MNERKPVVFYERDGKRAIRLFREGFQVRHPSLLDPVWRTKRCKRRPPVRLAWGYVYIFASGPFVKIGMSDANVKARWAAIKCGNPLLEPPLYVTSPLGNQVEDAEKQAHAALAKYHEIGEWFRCDRDLAIAVVKRIEQELQ